MDWSLQHKNLSPIKQQLRDLIRASRSLNPIVNRPPLEQPTLINRATILKLIRHLHLNLLRMVDRANLTRAVVNLSPVVAKFTIRPTLRQAIIKGFNHLHRVRKSLCRFTNSQAATSTPKPPLANIHNSNNTMEVECTSHLLPKLSRQAPQPLLHLTKNKEGANSDK
jgi:hypothetical protein